MTMQGITAYSISSEAVTIPAGAAGTVVNFYINKKPIADSNGCYLGGDGDTSLTLTSTAFTNEISKKEDAEMANGDYWVDYLTGKCRGKKATTDTTGTATYKIFREINN